MFERRINKELMHGRAPILNERPEKGMIVPAAYTETVDSANKLMLNRINKSTFILYIALFHHHNMVA